MGDNKKVPLNESWDYLQKSLNNLNIQHSTTSAVPNLYPKVNTSQNTEKPPQNTTNTPDKSNSK